ncbi:MAG: class I SAM-dependent rRNA methyltransferase [Bdellovibrio sp.]|nr:MAG: class I SAM-dependent rRNA methyltransferase [Bdellovibrio sp.]
MNRMSWQLKKGADRRVRGGHPWIFSNELAHSPRQIEPGTLIDLYSDRGEFLASGYGNPQSLIAFRVLSRKKDDDLSSPDFLLGRLRRAWRRRQDWGFAGSFRLVFSEADELPGLILDRYLLATEGSQVWALQILTAGMERLLADPLPVLQVFADEGLPGWDGTSVVLRKDAAIRKLEGLPVAEPQVLRARGQGQEKEQGLARAQVEVRLFDAPAATLTVDLVNGQKTGFFLDQSWNMKLVNELLRMRSWRKSQLKQGEEFHVLDLCCYVGHWSLQMARTIRELGAEPVVHLVDVSASALALAAENLRRAGLRFFTYPLDVLKDIAQWPAGPFDLLIVDPPALVKSRKDLAVAEAAYVKLNTEALRRARPGSLVVSCSCSGLVTEEIFSAILARAERKSGVRTHWLTHGGQSFDHPILGAFPEGKYLKMRVLEVLSGSAKKISGSIEEPRIIFLSK